MPDRPAETSEPHTSRPSAQRTASRFTHGELEQIFKHMVSGELNDGPLPYRRRRMLMGYAAQIGIAPFRASLLIAEAQREAGQLEDPELDVPDDVATLIHPERWPIWFKLCAALIVALLVDLVVIRAVGW